MARLQRAADEAPPRPSMGGARHENGGVAQAARPHAGWMARPANGPRRRGRVVEQVERELGAAAKAAELGEAPTFRRVAHEWLAGSGTSRAPRRRRCATTARCSTEPGTQHGAVKGVARGRIMERFGDGRRRDHDARCVAVPVRARRRGDVGGEREQVPRDAARDLHLRDAAGHLRRSCGGQPSERHGQALPAAAGAARPLRAQRDRGARAGLRAWRASGAAELQEPTGASRARRRSQRALRRTSRTPPPSR